MLESYKQYLRHISSKKDAQLETLLERVKDLYCSVGFLEATFIEKVEKDDHLKNLGSKHVELEKELKHKKEIMKNL